MSARASRRPREPSSRRAALLARFSTEQAGDHKHLITGSGVLVIGAAVQAVGGMLFSLIVAQVDTKSDFGNASALFTSVLFVTYLAGLGLPVSLARFSADRSRASHVIFTWGVLATVVSSVVASSLYLGLVHPQAADVLWDWNPVGGFARLRRGRVGLRVLPDRRRALHDHAALEPGPVPDRARQRGQGRPDPDRRPVQQPGAPAVPVPRRAGRGQRHRRRLHAPPRHRLRPHARAQAAHRPCRSCGTRRSTTCRRSPTRRRTSPSR